MLEISALFYGLIASFIMASTARNRRESRRNPPIVLLFGWFVLAFSAVMGGLLSGLVGWALLADAIG